MRKNIEKNNQIEKMIFKLGSSSIVVRSHASEKKNNRSQQFHKAETKNSRHEGIL
ncbi:Protein CBG28043 [Caenorhabditis briggsae]|uniref:Protein CBG28043 n=1 Tax=Caenorhabditis briggsae TaxID=6238 RepID=B6IGN3_CAEBR|nr:Protein CBG28043 [Caenorhabditis briggsae]CAR99063.1 Protein CBG28043 [Caenorhabditis briggsae]